MTGALVLVRGRTVGVAGERPAPPAIVTATGKAAAFAYAEFFGAAIESPHTYRAYRQAVDRFLTWCAARDVALTSIGPALLGGYLRELASARPTKKLHLSALRRFFDQLVLRHVLVLKPAASVRAPRHAVV